MYYKRKNDSCQYEEGCFYSCEGDIHRHVVSQHEGDWSRLPPSENNHPRCSAEKLLIDVKVYKTLKAWFARKEAAGR